MKSGIQIWRDDHGVAHVEAAVEPDLYWGRGFAHATDRGLQMLLMRVLGQGRVSELLNSSDDSLEIDVFFRRMNWSAESQPPLDVPVPRLRGGRFNICLRTAPSAQKLPRSRRTVKVRLPRANAGASAPGNAQYRVLRSSTCLRALVTSAWGS
jgi:hypothetical protein